MRQDTTEKVLTVLTEEKKDVRKIDWTAKEVRYASRSGFMRP